jgi:N,N'-diacetyllegionaminate synthase
MRKNFYLYTETAFHHEGDLEYLKKLVDLSKEAGADGIKFQVLTKVHEFISKNHSAYEKLASFCLSEEEWIQIFKYTERKGLDIIAMPLNISSFKILHKINIKFIDIHSVSFNDEQLKKAVKETKIPVLLSSGGRTITELEQLHSFFNNQLYGLMVGFQAFPSKLEDIKLSRISYLKNKFESLKIGYADHSVFNHEDAIDSNLYARLLGASIFEKHITLKEGDDGRVDYISAIESDKVKLIIEKLARIDHLVEESTEDHFKMAESELTYRDRELKVVSIKALSKNTIIEANDLCLRMIDQSGGFSKIKELIGKKINSDLKEHTLITKDIL